MHVQVGVPMIPPATLDELKRLAALVYADGPLEVHDEEGSVHMTVKGNALYYLTHLPLGQAIDLIAAAERANALEEIAPLAVEVVLRFAFEQSVDAPHWNCNCALCRAVDQLGSKLDGNALAFGADKITGAKP